MCGYTAIAKDGRTCYDFVYFFKLKNSSHEIFEKRPKKLGKS